MTHSVKAYACDYCHKILQSKSGASNHERHKCKYSPLAARCDGCAHLQVFKPDPEVGLIDGSVSCLKDHQIMFNGVVDIGLGFGLSTLETKRACFKKHCPDWSPRYQIKEAATA